MGESPPRPGCPEPEALVLCFHGFLPPPGSAWIQHNPDILLPARHGRSPLPCPVDEQHSRMQSLHHTKILPEPQRAWVAPSLVSPGRAQQGTVEPGGLSGGSQPLPVTLLPPRGCVLKRRGDADVPPAPAPLPGTPTGRGPSAPGSTSFPLWGQIQPCRVLQTCKTGAGNSHRLPRHGFGVVPGVFVSLPSLGAGAWRAPKRGSAPFHGAA